jgi:hypothetical protein
VRKAAWGQAPSKSPLLLSILETGRTGEVILKSAVEPADFKTVIRYWLQVMRKKLIFGPIFSVEAFTQ